MNLQALLRHLQVEFPSIQWELVSASVDKSKAHAIKYQPNKRFKLEIEPGKVLDHDGFMLSYSVGRNGGGGGGCKDIKELDCNIVEYLNYYQPKILQEGLQLSLFG